MFEMAEEKQKKGIIESDNFERDLRELRRLAEMISKDSSEDEHESVRDK